MTLTITGTTMTSDQTAHTARLAPGGQHLWEVSWLPGQALDPVFAHGISLREPAGPADIDFEEVE